MRFLIDMNLAPRWVPALSAAGHLAVHWSDVGPVSAPDSTICEYARDHSFILITNDLDFPRILAHTGAILTTSIDPAVPVPACFR